MKQEREMNVEVFERYKSGFENFICLLIGILGRILGFGTCFKTFL